jgi:SNF2 family DNA or RNA helicase
MISYKIDIDTVGTLTLSLYGATPEQFCSFADKAGRLRIPLSMASSYGIEKTMITNFKYKQSLLNLLNEMNAKEHPTDVYDVPHSARDNSHVKINLISFDLGDVHIKTDDFSAIFYMIVKKIFKNKLYMSGNNDFVISHPDYHIFNHFISELKRSKFNTTSLEPILLKLNKSDKPILNPVIFAEESELPNWTFKIHAYHGDKAPSQIEKNLKEIIEFIFPNSAASTESKDLKEETAEVDTGVKKVHYFRSDFKDSMNLVSILEKRGFNTFALRSTLNSLMSKGKMKKERIEGQLDGFDSVEKFKEKVKDYENLFFRGSYLPVEKHKFFPAQVEGIEFLYSRQSALLGDEVGVGKTLQFLVAADMRMQTTGGNCLIITKNAVVPQLIMEIQRIIGVPDSDISDNWSVTAKWNVLPYQIFEEDSAISAEDKTPLRELVTQSISSKAKSGKFSVCILDEVHMIKNGNPENRNKNGYLKHGENHRTFNIQEITQYIPFVWGASATIVANKPVDLYNQLKAINHNAGLMNYEKFKQKYGGDKNDPIDQFKKADKIRDLLTEQGVYTRRTKKEVNPEMPPIKIAENSLLLTEEEIEEVMKGAKNKDRPSAQEMSSIREKIAFAKIDNTMNLAEKILRSGKKVAVFTGHIKSLSEIYRKLSLLTEEIYPGKNMKVARIFGGQDRKMRQSEIQEFKKKDSNYMAIVISIDAGGTGIDFPNILSDVIINDFDWSPSDDDQSLGRFYRINSLNEVNVTYMIAQNTIDRRFYDLLKQKKEIAERIQTLSDEEKNSIKSGVENANEIIANIREKKWEAQKDMSDLDKVYRYMYS